MTAPGTALVAGGAMTPRREGDSGRSSARPGAPALARRRRARAAPRVLVKSQGGQTRALDTGRPCETALERRLATEALISAAQREFGRLV